MRSFPLWLKTVLPVVCVVVLVGGLSYFFSERRSQWSMVEEDLRTIGELKVEQIDAWRRERLGDAGVLMRRPELVANAVKLIEDPGDPAATSALLRRFEDLRTHYGYADVLLVDMTGRVVLSLSGDTGRIAGSAQAAVQTALAERRPALTDIHARDFRGPSHLSAVAPVLRENGQDEAVGAVLLVSDAGSSLYPIIQSWPTETRSAETLLVRREGDQVLFLNELRHQENTALTLRASVAREDLPAAAAARGEYGLIEGRDYRGVEVVAVALPVPGSPWSLVAKIDAAEAFAPWRFRSVMILVLLFGMLALLIALSLYVWQRRQATHYHELYETEAALRRSEERYGKTLRSIRDGVIATDADGHIELMNVEAERLLGLSLVQARGKVLADLLQLSDRDTGEVLDCPVSHILSEGMSVEITKDTQLTSRDGTVRPVSYTGAPIREDDGAIVGVVLVFRDMTEQRERERLLEDLSHRQGHLLRVLTAVRDVNELITRTDDRETLIERACECMTTTLERGSAVIILTNEDGSFRSLGSSGIADAAVGGLRASLERDEWPECAREILETPGVTTIPHAPGMCFNGEETAGEIDRAAFGTRLEFDGTVYGVFLVSVPTEFMSDESERKLFGEMASDIAFAIWKIGSQEKRAEAEERYRLLADNTVDCIWVLGLDARFQYVNPAIETLLGYEPGEVIGTDLHRYCTEEEFSRIMSEMQDALAELPGYEYEIFETELLHRDGHAVPVEITGTALTDDQGRPVAFQGVARDITERKKAEERLRESERILNQTGRLARVGGWEHDFITGKATWTLGLYEIMGIDPDTDAPGRDAIPDYYPPDDLAVAMEHYERAVREGTPFDIEVQVDDAQGRRLWVRVYGEPVFEDGRCVKMRGTFQDITERVHAVQSLRESEERWRSYVENAPYGVFVADRYGRYLDVNPAATRVTGYESDELLGMGVFEIIPESWQSAAEYSLRRLQEDGEWHGEVQYVHKSGEVRWWSIAAVKLSEDRLLGFVEDVTDTKNIEEEREELQSELIQAQKMESVGRLAGGVAHDFNNMLQVILGGTELLLAKLDKESGLADEVREIRKAAERSADLTRQLLAFSRQQMAEPRVIDLNEEISGMTKMLGRLIGEDIELSWEPAPEVWPVRIDPSQVNQVLANLVVNARDAIEETGTITIGTANADIVEPVATTDGDIIPGSYVVISVSDTGRGMDPATRAMIFEPFFTSKDVGEGTGLGLSTVWGIVRQNEGYVSVETAPGEGSSFHVYLPRHGGAAAGAAEGEHAATRRGSGETVLVVEDERAILSLCRVALERLGYSVRTAATPSEALRVLESYDGPLRLLITDVIMPEMNGHQLAELVLERQPGARVIYMSGYAASVIAKHGVLEEGTNFIQKPFSVRDLAAKVHEVLEKEKGR